MLSKRFYRRLRIAAIVAAAIVAFAAFVALIFITNHAVAQVDPWWVVLFVYVANFCLGWIFGRALGGWAVKAALR
jgi:hypothetical protein